MTTVMMKVIAIRGDDVDVDNDYNDYDNYWIYLVLAKTIEP
jgi:hypothetical protein